MVNPNENVIDPLFKVSNSPLQGGEAYRSPFYRRLLSAGYKGYIQGSLGGATLFGVFGAVLGLGAAAVAAPAASITIGTALIAVPIMAAGGMLYGGHAFSSIGAFAAIAAEQAEMSEKRRSLLDRYYETPSVEEAKEIERQLATQGEEKSPEKWYHWKTGLLGAVVIGGAALLALGIAAASPAIGNMLLEYMSDGLIHTLFQGMGIMESTAAGGGIAIGSFAAPAIIGSIGALAGAVVGVDRAYIRKWFDAQEGLHEDGSQKFLQQQHQRQLERLREAYRAEGFGQESRTALGQKVLEEQQSRQPISPRTLEPTTPAALDATIPLDSDKPQARLQANNDNQREVSRLKDNEIAVSV